MVVRQALPDDLARAGEVALAAYLADGRVRTGEPYAAYLADAARRAREAELLVAVDRAEQVVGTVSVCRPGTPLSQICRADEVEFRMLAVDPPARRAGVATALVHAVLQRASELGAVRVVLCSHDTMLVAQRIYQRLGFVRLPERDWWRSDTLHLLSYGRDL